MISPQPTMIRNVKNGINTGGLWSAGKSVSPTSLELRLMLPIKLWTPEG